MKFVILSFSTISLLAVCLNGGARQDSLPQGEGRDVFTMKCSLCHGLENATGMRRTREDWEGIVNDMEAAGALLTKDDMKLIVGYLAQNFGKININKAAAGDIESILSLSSSDATAIVTYRREHGDFKTIDDVKNVPGIHQSTIDEKKDWIAF
jgi:competence protein ComEA